MAKEMKFRDIAKKLHTAGATYRDAKGSHVMWSCCSAHSMSSSNKVVSAGVVRKLVQALTCLPEGWLDR
jgi:predicted RNA binding protein YcfA (HicA-like mRNA interferase family)